MSTSVREQIQGIQAALKQLALELPAELENRVPVSYFLDSARQTLDLALCAAAELAPEQPDFFQLGRSDYAAGKPRAAVLCVEVQQAIDKLCTGDPRALKIMSTYHEGWLVAQHEEFERNS